MSALQDIIAAAARQALESRAVAQYRIESRGMMAAVQLEAIGGPYARRAWTARIIGLDERFGLRREFLFPKRDFRDGSGTGNRGVMLLFCLEDGSFFEVNEPLSWKRDRRYFCRSEQGRIVEVDEAAVRDEMLRRAGR